MNLYEALGVSPQSSADEIKKAFFRLVRQHPPEKDPEGYKSLRSAYETLSDVKARSNYDALQKHGAQITELNEQAEKYFDDKNWDAAERCLKKILVLSPEADGAANLLGLCYGYADKLDKAIQLYESLTKRNPDVALYWSNLAYMCAELSNHQNTSENSRGVWRVKARGYFQKAIDIEPHNASAYMGIARSFLDEENFAQALEYAEQGVSADGKVDLQDIEIFMFMCIIHIRQKRFKEIDKIAERLTQIMPPDNEDAAKFVAMHFARLGAIFTEVDNYKGARELLKRACTFDPSNEELSKFHKAVQKAAVILDEFNKLDTDEQLVNPLKILAWIDVMDFLDKKIDDRENAIKVAFNQFDDYPPEHVEASLGRLKRVYPAIYSIGENKYRELARIVRDIVDRRAHRVPVGSTSSGCLLPLLSMFSGVAILLFVLLVVIGV